MSWGDYLKRGFEGAATMGLSEVKKKYYDDPANEQKTGYNTAGQASADLGTSQRAYETGQGNQALSYFSGPQDPGARPTGPGANVSWRGPSAMADWEKRNAEYQAAQKGPISPDQALVNMTNNRPTQQQDYFNFMGDQAHGKTNQETLFAQRMGGNDPAAAYQDQRATEEINKQLAARGRYNSGPGVRQVSDYLANANAQRSQQLAALAGGADQSRLGLDSLYGGAAKGASGEESKYYGDVMNASTGLAEDKAGIFGHYSDRGSDQYSEGQKAKIEAALAAAGVDAATAHQWLEDLGKTAQGIGQAAGAAKKGG